MRAYRSYLTIPPQVNFMRKLDTVSSILNMRYVLVYLYRFIGLVGRVFANGPEDWGSIAGRVISKT